MTYANRLVLIWSVLPCDLLFKKIIIEILLIARQLKLCAQTTLFQLSETDKVGKDNNSKIKQFWPCWCPRWRTRRKRRTPILRGRQGTRRGRWRRCKTGFGRVPENPDRSETFLRNSRPADGPAEDRSNVSGCRRLKARSCFSPFSVSYSFLQFR